MNLKCLHAFCAFSIKTYLCIALCLCFCVFCMFVCTYILCFVVYDVQAVRFAYVFMCVFVQMPRDLNLRKCTVSAKSKDS